MRWQRIKGARLWPGLALACVAIAGLGLAGRPGPVQAGRAGIDHPTQRMLLANGADGNWAAYGTGYASNHYSPLDQINQGNVGKLGLAWSIDLPTSVSSHSAPLAVDGVLYYSVGLSIISAVDAASGKPLWTYDPDVAGVAGDKLRPAWGLRGIGYWRGKIYAGTQDGRLIAIDANTGKPVWSVQTTTGSNDGRYVTGAPLLFDGKVMIGHGGADFAPVRGYVTTYDAETGKKLWRFYTVPGDPAKPDGEASDPVMAMAAKSWKGEWWKHGGGGTVWNAMAYDAELDRVYIGTGNGFPWNRNIRSPGGGDNLFLCAIVALEAKTGKYLWHYQTTPGESWDFNSAMDIELATIPIEGKPRRVLMHAPKNGFFYVIDRDTGKLISAKPFARVTWASGIDADGRPIETPEARYPHGETLVWPGGTGAHNWMAMSYSPTNRLVFIPKLELPGYYSEKGVKPATWKAPPRVALETGFDPFDSTNMPPATKDKVGALVAWDPVAQKARWSVPQLAAYNGGVASTGGNLVFQGDGEGKFTAYAADTGKPLWSFDAQNGILGQPIVYRAKGRQYVTVMTGYGAIASGMGPLSAQLGWDYRNQKRRLLTFAIGGKATLPPVERPMLEVLDDPAAKIDMAQVARGARAFNYCLPCHGAGAVAGGGAPDLRMSPAVIDAATFEEVVRGGALVSAGMPKFDELGASDLADLRMFIRYRARVALKPDAP